MCCNASLGVPLCAVVEFFERYLEVGMGITYEGRIVGLANEFSS